MKSILDLFTSQKQPRLPWLGLHLAELNSPFLQIVGIRALRQLRENPYNHVVLSERNTTRRSHPALSTNNKNK